MLSSIFRISPRHYVRLSSSLPETVGKVIVSSNELTTKTSSLLVEPISAEAAPLSIIPGISDRAIAGLSDPYRMRLAERAASLASTTAAGKPLPPIYYINPGSHAQVGSIPDAIISALPPPPRPLWPITAAEGTARVVRGLALSVVFAILAVYLWAKETIVSPGARARLETKYPFLASSLARFGLIDDLSSLDIGGTEELNARALALRVWEKFAPQGVMTKSRAQRLLNASYQAASGNLEAAAVGSGGNGDDVGSGGVSLISEGANNSISRTAFAEAFYTATKSFPKISIFLGISDGLGVRAAPPAAIEALGTLFDHVIAARGPKRGAAFSPAALSALAAELGFAADEAHAAAWLIDCSDATRSGAIPVPEDILALAAAGASRGPLTGTATGAAAASVFSPGAGRPVGGLGGTQKLVWMTIMRRSEFIDYMLLAAAASGVTSTERICDYVKVWEMLNVAREAAGVAPA